MALSKAILLVVLAALASALPRPTHWEPGPDDYNDPLALKGPAPSTLSSHHLPKMSLLLDFGSPLPPSPWVPPHPRPAASLTSFGSPALPISKYHVSLELAATSINEALTYNTLLARSTSFLDPASISATVTAPATATSTATPTATPDGLIRHGGRPRINHPDQLERDIEGAEKEMAAIEARLKTENYSPQEMQDLEQDLRMTRDFIAGIKAAQNKVVIKHATAVVNVIVETKDGVPTTMTTEFMMPEETKIRVPPGHMYPCLGPNCPEVEMCPSWGCGEPPCMGDDCFDDRLPLPPAPVPMPGPRPFPPGRPLPPRPILCDGPGCELPRGYLRCLDLLDCQPPIDEPDCMTTDCAARRIDEHLPKDPLHDAGTGPMDAQQE